MSARSGVRGDGGGLLFANGIVRHRIAAMSANDPVVQDLHAAYESGSLVVFAGAGVSAAAGIPTLKQLAETLRARLVQSGASASVTDEIDQLLRRDQIVDALSAVKLALGPRELGIAVAKALDDRAHGVPDLADAIAALEPRLRGVLTTCLDNLLNRAFKGAFQPLIKPPGDIAQQRGYILKLHGTLEDRSTWVFLRDEYDQAMFGSPQLQVTFGAIYRAAPILFVGCDLADENLELTLSQVRAVSRDQPPTHYALLAEPVTPFRRRSLESAGLRLITYSNGDGKHGALVAILRRLAGETVTASLPVSPAVVSPGAQARKGLPRATLMQIQEACVHSGLVQSRGALLGGIDSALVAAFPSAGNPASQLLSDLTELDRLGRLPDDSVPLATWLQNAISLAGPRREARVFKEALAALSA
jgi:SIR2-like protein/effector-associated domain 5 (EAD5)-containing protein